MDDIRVVAEPHASEQMKAYVRDSLSAYNIAATGQSAYLPVAFFLKDAHQAIVGGLLGNIWGGWLHVEILWVAEPLRRRRYGTTLLEAAERYAVERDCSDVYLDSFSFQAPAFYQKLGYEIVARLEDRPPGHTHFVLRKRLPRKRA
jgi:ribosomal protein S18 acetylase RimI-like enzyme